MSESVFKKETFNGRNICDCGKKTSHNYEGFRAHFCITCSLEGMIDRVSKQCSFINLEGNRCITRAGFNYETEIRPKFCSLHKKDKMIDISNRHRKCVFVDFSESINRKGIKCRTKALYNFEGEYKAKYCEKHKKNEMINIKEKPCEKCKIRKARSRGFCRPCMSKEINILPRGNRLIGLKPLTIKCKKNIPKRHIEIPKEECISYPPDPIPELSENYYIGEHAFLPEYSDNFIYNF